MKNYLLLGLAVLSLQTAFAYDNGPGGRDPRDPGRDNNSKDSRDLTQCLRDLSDVRFNLDQCRRNGVDQREADALRRDVQMLRDQNNSLLRENQDLRFQLDQMRPARGEVFAYAACTDIYSNADLKKVGSGVGMNSLEAESKALADAQRNHNCSYGVKVIKNEQITSYQDNAYCSAACTDIYSNADLRKQSGERGRNKTEATFNALLKAQKTFSCSYGVKIVSCQ